jgi:hypothetical protein
MSGIAKLFGSGDSPAPAPKPVVAMPDPESDASKRAARLEELRARSRSGRSSTILSGEGEYSSSTLGTN